MCNNFWILTVGLEPKLKLFEDKDATSEYYLILDKNAPIEALKKDEEEFQEEFKKIKPRFPNNKFASLINEVSPFVREANFNVWENYLEWWKESLESENKK